jgi:hypothetical protein
MKTIIAIILFVLMTLLTAVSLFPSFNRFFFAGGSTESLMELVTSNFYIQAILLLACGYLGYRLLKNFDVKILILLICIFLMWVMSGRTIGVFSDGKIKTGWFYFATNELNLCVDDKADCQTVTDYQTKIEKKFFWFVEIKNTQVNKNIFIGAVIWYTGTKMLSEKFGAGKYTQ